MYNSEFCAARYLIHYPYVPRCAKFRIKPYIPAALIAAAASAQISIPAAVGIRAAAAAHFQPPASFLMVRREVEHGQCISENSIVQTAVCHVQPFAESSCASSGTEISARLPCAM